MNKDKDICSTCGFPKSMIRNPIILDNNILSLMKFFEEEETERCKECGHMKSGYTIKSVNDYYTTLIHKIRKKVKEQAKQKTAKEIFAFIDNMLDYEWSYRKYEKFKEKFLNENVKDLVRNFRDEN